MISRLLGIAALAAGLFAISADAALAERRVALVIGNSAYQNVIKLPNPARDAAAVAAMLKKAGFDVVESRSDLSNTAMRRALRKFARTALRADIAVVYYAGHGIEVGGTNYLIPVDAQLASDLDVVDETISLDRIMRMLEPVKRLRLVILDACRDNPFTRKMKRTNATRSIRRGLAKVEVTTTDTLVAFAAKAGMTAADGDGDHSPFTTALLDNLAVPGLDLRIAFGRVRDEVLKITNNTQEPFVYGSLGGSTVALVPKPVSRAAVKPTEQATSPANKVARDYAFAERVGTLEAWQSFLTEHKSGFYADLARAARDKILAAKQQQKAEPRSAEKTKVATLEKPTAASPQPKKETDSVTTKDKIARDLQRELARVGCPVGQIDGNWGRRSRDALRRFNHYAKLDLDPDVPSRRALEAVQKQRGSVCPKASEPARRKPSKRTRQKPRVAHERAPAARKNDWRAISPLCQSPYTMPGRVCCAYDPPSGAAPQIICR